MMPALEAPSLPDGAGIEVGRERHLSSVLLTLWSSGEEEDRALPGLRV